MFNFGGVTFFLRDWNQPQRPLEASWINSTRHLSGVAALTATKPLWSNLSILRHGGFTASPGFTLREFLAILGQLGYQPPKNKGGVVAKIKVLVVGLGVFLIIAQYLWIGRNEFLSLEHVDDSSHLFISFAMFHMWNILVLPSEHSGSYGTGYPPKGYQNYPKFWFRLVDCGLQKDSLKVLADAASKWGNLIWSWELVKVKTRW